MSYLNENGLARYDGLIKNWTTFKSGTVDGVDPLLNWQKTSTAGAVTFYPLPTAPIDPTVNFLFTESGPASGTKGPDNPSTIAGVTQAKVTRCGKNLIWTPWQDATTVTRDGITWTVNGDGTVTASGTATADSYFNVRASTAGNRQRLDSGLTYVLSGCPASGSNTTYLLAFVCNSATFKDFGAGTTCSVNADDSGWISCIVRTGVTVSNLVFKPQLELGSTATSFEPYEGADYTIDLGGTYYGGSLDLSTGTMTVTRTAIPLAYFSASNGINQAGYAAFRSWPSAWGGVVVTNADPAVCEELPYSTDSSDGERFYIGSMASDGEYPIWVYLSASRLDLSGAVDPSNPTTAEVKDAGNAFIADHPLHIVASLATPQIVQLTPQQIYSLSQADPYTPRINTVYSDQVSVQVGYPKSPQATASELTNAIVSLGGNI